MKNATRKRQFRRQFESTFEKSNRSRRIRNSRDLNREVEIREIELSNEIREIEFDDRFREVELSNEIREVEFDDEFKMRFEKSNRTTKATISTRNFDDAFEFEIRHEIREVEFVVEFKVRFEKSNRAMKRKTRIRNSRNLSSTLESKIEIREIEFDDEFKARFEKSNRATKREIRIRNSTTNSKEKLAFKTRHKNFGISHETQRKQKSFTTNDRRTTRSSLTRNAHTLTRNDPRTHTRDTHVK